MPRLSFSIVFSEAEFLRYHVQQFEFEGTCATLGYKSLAVFDMRAALVIKADGGGRCKGSHAHTSQHAMLTPLRRPLSPFRTECCRKRFRRVMEIRNAGCRARFCLNVSSSNRSRVPRAPLQHDDPLMHLCSHASTRWSAGSCGRKGKEKPGLETGWSTQQTFASFNCQSISDLNLEARTLSLEDPSVSARGRAVTCSPPSQEP